jgi:tRNA dimethylallyltransferase
MESARYPLIAIVGQTATGKSDLAMRLAIKYGGEIVAADSRTIYKGMDIGTAKPSPEDQMTVPHHGIDLIEPDQTFSAAKFKQYAKQSINSIYSRGKIPFVVGGTGLYVDGLLYDFEFNAEADISLRKELERMSLENLQQRAKKLGISEDDIDFKNRRHLSRVVERRGITGNRTALPGNVLILGMEVEKEVLEKRIETRIGQMLNRGFEKEVQKLLTKYTPGAPGLLTPGYKEFGQHSSAEIDFEGAKNEFIRSHKKLAKRQKTWFKRNKDIVWVQSFEQADKTVSNFLRKFATIEQ